NFFVGLAFEVPSGNRAAEARLRQAQVASSAALIAYEDVVRQVVLEVKEALRNLRTDFELVSATRASRLAQTENLRALEAEREQRSRLSPEFLNLVFGRQEGLAAAQLGEVQALAEYNRSLAALQRALGTGLNVERIEFSTK
ncbi:MAG: outer membrane protein, partial [Planctomycetota bacterium]